MQIASCNEVKYMADYMGYRRISRGRVTVTRQAHNLKIVGAIPAPATRLDIVELLEDLPVHVDRVLGIVVCELEARGMCDVIPDFMRVPSVLD